MPLIMGHEVAGEVAQRRIQPVVDQVFSMEDVELAFDVLRQGRSLGRKVLAISDGEYGAFS